jgi:hypothetical protein
MCKEAKRYFLLISKENVTHNDNVNYFNKLVKFFFRVVIIILRLYFNIFASLNERRLIHCRRI